MFKKGTCWLSGHDYKYISDAFLIVPTASGIIMQSLKFIGQLKYALINYKSYLLLINRLTLILDKLCFYKLIIYQTL